VERCLQLSTPSVEKRIKKVQGGKKNGFIKRWISGGGRMETWRRHYKHYLDLYIALLVARIFYEIECGF
jgi:hypothetical protein